MKTTLCKVCDEPIWLLDTGAWMHDDSAIGHGYCPQCGRWRRRDDTSIGINCYKCGRSLLSFHDAAPVEPPKETQTKETDMRCEICKEPIKMLDTGTWVHGDGAVSKGWCGQCFSWMPTWRRDPLPAPMSCPRCGGNISECHDAAPAQDMAPAEPPRPAETAMIKPQHLSDELAGTIGLEAVTVVGTKALIGILECLQKITRNGLWTQSADK